MIQHLIIGIVVSFLGSLPIGVLNLNAMDIGIKKGMRELGFFALGAGFIEFFQVIFSILIMHWMIKTEAAKLYFDYAALPIFLILALYYFNQFKKEKTNQPLLRKRNEFQWAVILSAINPLVYPFWIFYAAYLQSIHWISLKPIQSIFFAGGVSIGTFAALYIFGYTGRIISKNIPSLSKLMTLIIGCTFLVLVVIQLYRIYFL